MEEIATRLSRAVGQPYLRVDLYARFSDIYFSELTFAPGAGKSKQFFPDELDNVLGFMIAHPEDPRSQAPQWETLLKTIWHMNPNQICPKHLIGR